MRHNETVPVNLTEAERVEAYQKFLQYRDRLTSMLGMSHTKMTDINDDEQLAVNELYSTSEEQYFVQLFWEVPGVSLELAFWQGYNAQILEFEGTQHHDHGSHCTFDLLVNETSYGDVHYENPQYIVRHLEELHEVDFIRGVAAFKSFMFTEKMIVQMKMNQRRGTIPRILS